MTRCDKGRVQVTTPCSNTKQVNTRHAQTPTIKQVNTRHAQTPTIKQVKHTAFPDTNKRPLNPLNPPDEEYFWTQLSAPGGTEDIEVRMPNSAPTTPNGLLGVVSMTDDGTKKILQLGVSVFSKRSVKYSSTFYGFGADSG